MKGVKSLVRVIVPKTLTSNVA